MLKFTLKYSVAEAAKLLEVDNDIIKKWCYHFSEYLSRTANPPKGTPRLFELEDIRVFGYICQYWEADPDIEYIKIGLNSNDQHNDFLIDEFILLNTPFMIEPPQDIDETWTHGIVFQGLSEFANTFSLAKSYKLAGDRLVEAALANEENHELYAPAMFNYRHAVELYMKAIIGKYKQSHNLVTLLEKLKVYIKKEYNASLPPWFENTIMTFNEFDPWGTTMRYGGRSNMEEMFINFNHMKSLMELLAKAFQNIRFHQGFTNGM